MFAFTPQHVVIGFPERKSDCPEPKTFKKISHKKHIAIPMTKGRDERLTMPKGFGAFMVNQCAGLWWGRNLWVATAHSHLPCFALCRKTTPKKQRAAKPYKMAMNWAQVTQKKQHTDPSLGKCNLFLYLCLYVYVLTAILNFSYKFFKSFVICKTVSKLAVIYAPSLGPLWSPGRFSLALGVGAPSPKPGKRPGDEVGWKSSSRAPVMSYS